LFGFLAPVEVSTAEAFIGRRFRRIGRMKCLGRSPLVSMMETSDLRKFHRSAQFGRLNRPGLRRIFDQR